MRQYGMYAALLFILFSTAIVAEGAAYQSNIQPNAIDVEVNTPVIITFASKINPATVNEGTFYLEAASGQKQWARLNASSYSIRLIPQIRLRPNGSYTAIVRGVRDAAGNTIEEITIPFTNRDLDFGLYWYGKDGVCEKYLPGLDNAFYNPAKSTVIYAHGWQAGSIEQLDSYDRQGYNYETFLWRSDNFGGSSQYNGLREWTSNAWIDKGWNTGIVYWNQFADEPSASDGNVTGVLAAETKIWNLVDGARGSRYVTLNENGERLYKDWNRQVLFGGQTITVESIGKLLGLYVKHALRQNTSGNIRLVGHSLGNQVANFLAKQCYDEGIEIQRIALLDPAWSAGEKDYLPDDGYGKWVGERCRNFLFEMRQSWPNLAIEIYHTTGINLPLGVMDNNQPLTSQVCDVNFAPWYYSAQQLAEKHVSMVSSYFWSMEAEPPVECTISWWRRIPTGQMGPSASTPDWRIRDMMSEEYQWTHVEGRYTPDPADDWFERKSK